MMLSDGLLRLAAAAYVHIVAGPGEIVVVIRNLPTPPQPRQNRNTRWGKGRNAEKALDYNAWRGPLRDLLRRVATYCIPSFYEMRGDSMDQIWQDVRKATT